MNGPDDAHKVEYTFNVPETEIYRIKVCIHGANGFDDSFWVKTNGSPSEGYLWNVFVNTSYQTDYLNDHDGAVFFLLKRPVIIVFLFRIHIIVALMDLHRHMDQIEIRWD